MNDFDPETQHAVASLFEHASSSDLNEFYQLNRASSPNPTEEDLQPEADLTQYKDEMKILKNAAQILGSDERLYIMHNAMNMDRSLLELYYRKRKLGEL
jgi:hypothetical protein